MLKKLLVVLFATTFMATTNSVLAEDKKVDTENAQSKQNNQHSQHSHAKDAKGVPQSETKEAKDANKSDAKQDTKKHFHPRDGK